MSDALFQEPSSRQYRFSDSNSSLSNKKRIILVIVFLLLIGGLLFGASRLLVSNDSSDSEPTDTTPTPTEYVFPTDTPTPTEEVDTTPTKKPTVSPTTTTKSVTPTTSAKTTTGNKSTLTIEVQNGSGTAGAASKMADTLKGLGYTVSGTKNADTYDYTSTEIQIKSSKSSFLPTLKKDLEASYTIGNTSSSLSASTSADAVVIVGKE